MHAAEAVSSPLSPTAMAVTRCDRSSYKKSLFSRIRVSPRTTSLGLRPQRRFPSPSRVCVGSNHSGMGKPIVHCAFSHLRARWRGHVCHINRVAGRGVRGREGRGAGVAGAQPAQRSTEEQ